MSLPINQDIDAVNSYRNLSVAPGQMSTSLEKLSSAGERRPQASAPGPLRLT